MRRIKGITSFLTLYYRYTSLM